jgi:oligopeptide transport system ATP-binding protein
MTGIPAPAAPILEIDGLVTEFRTEAGLVRAVDGVSYAVGPGECLGVVGESGSGKSVTVSSALGLLPRAGRVVAGAARFQGADLVPMTERQLNRVRGRDVGVVFQDPMTALNPVMTIGAQIEETIRAHQPALGRRERQDRVLELLSDVGIASGRERMAQYPHQFSGGMRQRIMIAIAIANRPKLIIADEPTTALDVTIQAQILDLLARVQEEVGAALVLITHDLGVIAELADRVVVMRSGRVLEEASVDDLFHDPRHPYTRSLLASLPRIGERVDRLAGVAPASGEDQELVEVAPGHRVAMPVHREGAPA